MIEQDFVALLVRGHPGEIVFQLSKPQVDRLKLAFSREGGTTETGRFIHFETVDERSVAVNLDHLEGIVHEYDPYGMKSLPHPGGDYVWIHLKGHAQPLIESPSSEVKILELYESLKLGASAPPFLDLDNGKCRAIYLRTSDLVVVSAPTELIAEGRRIREEDNSLV